ncbi:WD40 repeat domain-containing serine/threonine protein kinase [Nocardia sp. NPDC059240]|uniref:WD40 repeat domain-containing serine/threonine protein kinase n=1 Tax=Nocardia sp. NPDC059240 TaxID=3346786 RepID=UPI0036B9A405
MLRAGEIFAGYTVERMLGIGGMGAVYLARHPRMNRRVALKVLNDDLAADPKARMAFERESILAVELDHPNIIPIYDRSSPRDPALWLAMRHIDGGDASSLLTPWPDGLPVQQAIRLITDAAHALDYAHGKGVLHRDVKPANLLIEHDPRVGERALLTDFGIARTLDDTTTHSGVVASLAYTAPERFTDQRPTDHRADIYSLGCTFYQLLTGHPPFPRSSQAAVIAAHLGQPVPLTTTRRPDLPRGLDLVIATSLAKDPGDRYRTCADLADAAHRALGPRGNTGTLRRPTPPPESPAPAPPSTTVTGPRNTTETGPKTATTTDSTLATSGNRRISRRTLLIGGAITVPVTAAVIATAVTQLDSGGGSSNGPAPSSSATLDGVLAGHGDAVTAIAFSPDGTQLASGSFDQSVRLWDIGARKPAGEALTTGHAVHALAFSPDGTLLATTGGVKGDWATQLWDVNARQPDGPSLNPGACTGIEAVAFSPDGALLAVGRRVAAGPAAQLWSVRTRQLDGQQLDSGVATAALAFSPDGALLAASQGVSIDSRVRLWNTASRQWIPADFTGHLGEVVCIAFSPDGTLLATSSLDTTARLWDVRSRQPLGPLTGHVGAVSAVAFSPDGKQIVSGGVDNTVRLWDVKSRSRIGQPLTGHTDRVSSVRFSPDGTVIASGSHDGTIRLWRVTRN